MNGKELKVEENTLTFGASVRKVNVFGVFKYKPNNNLYVIYTDTDTSYSVVHYGTSHIKNDSILSMSSNKDRDENIIKEYIFKITEKEDLSNFEIINLDNIEKIEIISSNQLAIKKEVLDKLISITIPKKQEEVTISSQPKKKGSIITKLASIIIIFAIIYGGFYYYTNFMQNNELNSFDKSITCTKQYTHNDLNNVRVDEEQTFTFNNNDILDNVKINTTYNFNSEEDYNSFIIEGTYYAYLPDGDALGGTKQDDEKHTFSMIEQIKIDETYNKPTEYEEVLSYYKNEGYTCNENNLN